MHAEVLRVFKQLGETLARCADMERPVLRYCTGLKEVVKSAATTPPNSVVIDEVKLPLHPSPIWRAAIQCLSDPGMNATGRALTIPP